MKMKALLYMVLACNAIGAHAGTIKEYDSNALELLNAVTLNCPIQFIQAMRGADFVGSARLIAPRPPGSDGPVIQTYEITTVRGGFAPSFETEPVTTLTVTRRLVREETIPDKPSTWTVSCELRSE